ncbi:MAG: hypothetical protein EAX96_17095 [Candidatus Lokiarchaeota archaeon]|nr:hypothetical protein [Candidatus Lokiarchaeota archaeon]
MNQRIIDKILEKEEKIQYALIPSVEKCVLKYKKERKKSAVKILKILIIFTILSVIPLFMFPDFYTKIVPNYLEISEMMNDYDMIYQILFVICILLFLLSVIGGSFYIIISLVEFSLNYIPINRVVLKNENKELLVTNKKIIIINNNSNDYDFYFYDSDFYLRQQICNIYSKVEQDELGKHLYFGPITWKNLADEVDLEEINNYIRDRIKEIYSDARFENKTRWERGEENKEK